MSLLARFRQPSETLPQCVIVIHGDEDPTFTAGEIISGWVELEMSNPLSSSAELDISMKGISTITYGKNNGIVGGGGGNRSKTDTFLVCKSALGDYENSTSSPSPGGIRRIPFELKIEGNSKGMPGTMTSPHGSISYNLIVHSIKQGQHPSTPIQLAEKSLKVEGYLSLKEQEPFIMNSVLYEKSEGSTSEFPVVSNLYQQQQPTKLTVTFRLLKSGFLPGEGINFSLEVWNPNKYEIPNMSVTLIQKIQYGSGLIRKVQAFDLKTLEENRIDDQGRGNAIEEEHNEDRIEWNQTLWIPTEGVKPSCEGLIAISHILKIRVSSNSPNCPLLLDVPIVLGSCA